METRVSSQCEVDQLRKLHHRQTAITARLLREVEVALLLDQGHVAQPALGVAEEILGVFEVVLIVGRVFDLSLPSSGMIKRQQAVDFRNLIVPTG